MGEGLEKERDHEDKHGYISEMIWVNIKRKEFQTNENMGILVWK